MTGLPVTPPASIEELAATYKYHHSQMVAQGIRRGGMSMDHATLAILTKWCSLSEVTLRSLAYYHHLLNPSPTVKRAFLKEGLILKQSIVDKTYFFKVQVVGSIGIYGIRITFPCPAASFQPLHGTVH